MNRANDYLDEALTTHATAYVRNLAAAEQAVQRGQFNVAKILRAAATAQRTMALIRGVSPEQWATTGPMLGEVRSLLDVGTWHANHEPAHIAQIRRMLAPHG